MRKHKLFFLAIALITAIGLVGCAETPTPPPPPKPTATSVPPPAAAPTPVPPTATSVPPTAIVAPTATKALPTPTTAKEITATFTWLGHPTFILKTSTGLIALLDPMGAGVGYPLTPVSGVDLVTVSHEHFDHNNVGLATGSPLVLRGLVGNDWAKIDQTVKGVRVRTVPSYHDDTQGTQRGKNAIFVFEMEGLKIAHLGDLGHKLSDDQIKAIGAVDLVMLPVGGFFTIDGRGAAEIVGQLNPKVIVPMHYKTPALSASLARVLAEVGGFTAAIGTSAKVTQAGHTITLTAGKLPAERTVMVMNYK